MDKQERKEIKKELKQQEQDRLLALLPMPANLLKDLFDYLDEKLSEGSSYPGNTLRLTETFCVKNDLDFEKIKAWAAELGGFDDAEILWNCEEPYEFLIGGGNVD
jgi:hypothetical protein